MRIDEDARAGCQRQERPVNDAFALAAVPPPLRRENIGLRGEPADESIVATSVVYKQADVKGADDNGSTALIRAVQLCPLAAVEVVTAAGADVNAKARGDATPPMTAEVVQRSEIAEALKKAGVKPWQ